MKKIVSITLLALLLGVAARAQTVNWVRFDDLLDSMEVQPKNILIFFTADWCKFCKVQDNTTFKDSAVVAELNKNYYCLRMNTDDTKPIDFFGTVYERKPGKGIHEFVEQLALHNGQLKLPTTVIIYNMQLRARLQGMIDKEEFFRVFGELE